MNGEFGWSNSATILNAKGHKVLGRMYKKAMTGSTVLRTSLDTMIYCPKDLTVPTKLTLIGTCLHLVLLFINFAICS